MSEEKQIEEMARDLFVNCSQDYPCTLVPIGAMCKTVWKRSEALYNAGYRKQNEGEWILQQNGKGVCSKCKRQDNMDELACFCRYCGARMKGGAE